jgi:hypothetical protein
MMPYYRRAGRGRVDVCDPRLRAPTTWIDPGDVHPWLTGIRQSDELEGTCSPELLPDFRQCQRKRRANQAMILAGIRIEQHHLAPDPYVPEGREDDQDAGDDRDD